MIGEGCFDGKSEAERKTERAFFLSAPAHLLLLLDVLPLSEDMESLVDAEAGIFILEPLQDAANELRLLHVVDGEHQEDVHCTLSTFPVSQMPEYMAISYTWGDPLDLQTIFVNGKPCTVRRNCKDVLQQIRALRFNEYIWLDALCINQEDDQEKSFQVAMMGKIYRTASMVLVCVGPHENDSEYLFQCIEGQTAHIRAMPEDSNKFSFVGALLSDDWENDTESWDLFAWFQNMSLSDLDRMIRAAHAFTYRAYFTRLWVIQEIFLAKSALVVCGHTCVGFGDFESFYQLAMRYSSICAKHKAHPHSQNAGLYFSWETTNMLDCRGQLGTEEGIHWSTLNLVELVEQFSYAKCHDPRDKVFGVISMVTWNGRQPLLPDYSLTPWLLIMQICSTLCRHRDSAKSRKDRFGSSWLLRAFIMGLGFLVLEHSKLEYESMMRPRRFQGPSGALGANSTFRDDENVAFIPFSVDGHCRLFQDHQQEGNFVTCLTTDHPEHGSFPYSEETFSGFVNQTSVPYQTVSGQSRMIQAMIPGFCQANDILMCFKGWRQDMLALVARRRSSGSNVYQIIGQALVNPNVSVCPKGYQDRKGTQHECTCGLEASMHAPVTRDWSFTLWFSPQGLVAFAFQDQRCFEGEPEVDPELTLQRLVTSATEPERPFSSFVEFHPVDS